MSALIIGGFLFFSISIGSAAALLFSRLFQHTTQGLSLLSGSFLIGLLVFEIIPTSFTMYKPGSIILGLVLGYLFFQLLDGMLHPANHKNPSVYLLTLAIFIHTIPLSLAIGNLLVTSAFSVAIITSLLMHHIPEGFALTTAFISQGEKLQNLFLCFIGLSTVFSFFVWVGFSIALSVEAQGLLMGFSISLIATTSLFEFIIQNTRNLSKRLFWSFIVLGFLLSYGFHFVVG